MGPPSGTLAQRPRWLRSSWAGGHTRATRPLRNAALSGASRALLAPARLSGRRGARGWPASHVPSLQRLQLALAPLHSLAALASEHGLPDPGSLLVHSFRQLDRVDSLSEQISFLEEQLGSCSCRKEL